MAFKIASLFVSIEAETNKFSQQLGGIKKQTGDAGKELAGTDFSAIGDRLEAIFAALPARLAAAMNPVASKVQASLSRAVQPVSQLQSTILKVGAAVVHGFRFDLIEHGLAAAKTAVDQLFKGATGGAAALGASLKSALAFGELVNGIQRLSARIQSLLSPSKNIARVILGSTRVGLMGARSAVDLLFSKSTGRAAILGKTLNQAFTFAIAITRSKIVVDRLAAMIQPIRLITSLTRGFGSAIGQAARAAVNLTSHLTGARKAAGGIKGVLGEIAIAAGFIAVGYKIVEFFKEAVEGASHLAETVDKVDAVLGSGSAKVKAYADRVAMEFGLVKRTTLDAASGFGGLAKTLGKLKGNDLADFSIKMTQLAADFTAFADLDFDEAQKSIKIGLTGEPSDVLKQFGVVILEARTKQKALEMGMKLVNGQLTQQQKLMANAALITQGLADAEDNMALTAGSTQSRMRRLSGTIENLKVAIGTALLPVVNKTLSLFQSFAVKIGEAFERNRPVIDKFIQKIVVGLDVARVAVKNWQVSLNILKLFFGQWAHNISEYFRVMGQNIVILTKWAGRQVISAWTQTLNYLKAQVKTLGDDLVRLMKEVMLSTVNPLHKFDFSFTPMLDNFKIVVDQLPGLLKPNLVDMSGEIAKLWKGIAGQVKWNPEIRPAVKKGQAVDTPDEVVADKKNGRLSDIEAFAKSLQVVGEKNKAQEKTAKATEQTVEQLKKLNEAFAMNKVPNGGNAVGAGWQVVGLF